MATQHDGVLCANCGDGVEGFFSSLAGAKRVRIERGKTLLHFARGDMVFRDDEPATSIYCIHTGAVKVYKLGPEGEEIVIRLLGPGEIMGYRPLLANDRFAASARALEDTTVCSVARELLMETLRESPELAMNLMEKLARELRVSEDQMVRRVVETVPQRTARFLLWLHNARSDAANHVNFESVLRREDMAMVIGTTPETLSRVLHDLERQNIVGLSRRAIRVREPEALQLLAAHGSLD